MKSTARLGKPLTAKAAVGFAPNPTHRTHQPAQGLIRQLGVTLIELMVSLVIGLIISLAAAGAYIGTRSAANAQEELSRTHEYGKQAMDMIGRELQMAGFYPIANPNTDPANGTLQTQNFGEYKEPVALVGRLPYQAGVFGCTGARFLPATNTCGPTVAGAPDSVVVNYYSNPEFGNQLQNQSDCLGADVALDPVNAPRAAAGLPLFISNRFALSPTLINLPTGGTAATLSFGCNGNGTATPSNIYQPIFEGVVDMVITYGLWNTGTNAEMPDRYLTANAVTTPPLPALVNGKTPWQRVTRVNVCLMVNTLQNTRQADAPGTPRTFTDCRGGAITSPRLFKVFNRTFTVRNHMTGEF